MKPIRVFRHIACEGPGYLGEVLDRNGVAWELVCIDEKQPVPRDLERVSGLIFMGAAGSVNDPKDWIVQELTMIREAHAAGVPMLGICFGGQLISKALGGGVTRGACMEIGWHPLRRVTGCRCNGWFAGLPAAFETFHWHADTFTPPPGALPLLQSPCYRNQAFALDDHLGMQFHLEMTEKMIAGWISHYGSDLNLESRCIQPKEAMLSAVGEKLQQLHRVADVVYGQWLARVMARNGD